MKALAIMMFLFGIYVLLSPAEDDAFDRALEKVVATNFVTYRNAAWRYVYTHKDQTGEVPTSVLSTLPQGWLPIRDWHTRIHDGRCYIYGNVTQSEVNAIKDIFKSSYALGFVVSDQEGQFMRNIRANAERIPIPAAVGIPDGYAVSVSNLD